MDDLFLLSEAQMRRIKPYFPPSHGVARVDDRRVVSGIVVVIRMRWRDCAARLQPAQDNLQPVRALEPLFGMFNKIFAELARKGGKPRRLMIDATLLKTHRTAASLLKMGLFPDVSAAVLTVNSIPLVQSRESGDALEDMLKLACAS